MKYEPKQDKTNKMTCAPREDSLYACDFVGFVLLRLIFYYYIRWVIGNN